MEDRLQRIEGDIAAVRTDVASLRAESATKADLAVVRAECATKADLGVVREDLASIKVRLANLEANCATKADLAELRGLILESKADLLAMMNAQTWKFVTWMTATMGMMTTAVWFIARNVH